MVLYFTQSRGQATGIKLESEIHRFLIDKNRPAAAPPVDDRWKPYSAGAYTANIGGALSNTELTVKIQNNRLAVDIPGQFVFQLDEPGRGGIAAVPDTPPMRRFPSTRIGRAG